MENSIFSILHNIQQKLNAPKGKTNTFANFKYRSCEDIIEAVKPLLPQNTVINMNDDIVIVGLDRFYIKSTASIISDSGTISAVGIAREALTKKGMDDSQITGMASSYARKYALSGLLAIDDGHDDDAADHSEAKKPKKELPGYVKVANTINDEMKKYTKSLSLKGYWENQAIDRAKIAAENAKTSDWLVGQYNTYVEKLEKLKKEADNA